MKLNTNCEIPLRVPISQAEDKAMLIRVNIFPFGQSGDKPSTLLHKSGHDVLYSPTRLIPEEVYHCAIDADGIIAGTEPYPKELIARCPNLKVIARVGVGLDNIDLEACQEAGVVVTYTPDAPSLGVAEFTIGLIIDLLRGIVQSNTSVKAGQWDRIMGSLVGENTIGILGVGRIGKYVARLLSPFRPKALLGCDLTPDYTFGGEYGIEWVDRAELFRRCNLVTVHVPLNAANVGLVDSEELGSMRHGYLINTARGPIINETSVLNALDGGELACYASDVFDKEPYYGPLKYHHNAILTAHIASSARRSCYLMELGATEDCLAVLRGEEPRNPIPSI